VERGSGDGADRLQQAAKAAQEDWLSVARYVVGAFRADAARAGATAEIEQLVDELSRSSPEFAALWRENDVARHSDGLKRIRHPELGMLELEFSAFSIDGRPDLGMIVYNPATPDTAERIRLAMVAGAGDMRADSTISPGLSTNGN
jgi:hypothetical protein